MISGQRELSAQQFTYERVAAGGIAIARTTATAVDAQARSVTLADSTRLPYDRMVLAPGIDIRWGAGDPERLRKYAAELIALAPDVILANSSQAVAALLQATRAVPIVFVSIADPVGAGFVESVGRPGGNATGVNFLVEARK